MLGEIQRYVFAFLLSCLLVIVGAHVWTWQFRKATHAVETRVPPIVDDKPADPPASSEPTCGCGPGCECDDWIARRRPKR